MFVVSDNSSKLQRARAKARTERTEVQVLSFGRYEVEGAGSTYTVEITQVGYRLTAHCNCMAGLYGNECYHAAAAIDEHVRLAEARAQAATRPLQLEALGQDLKAIRRLAAESSDFETADEIAGLVRAALRRLSELEQTLAPAAAAALVA